MTRSPRVLFLDQSGELGGAELYLLDLARAHRSTSHVVLFESGPFYDRLCEEGISAEVLLGSSSVQKVRKDGGLLSGLRAVPDLARLVHRVAQKASSYDLLFANTQKALLVAGLAGLWTKKPVVWNLHDLLTPDHFTAINRRVAVTAANLLCTHVIANSEASRSAFKEAGGRTPTTVVYNGLDPAPFDAVTKEDEETLRQALGVGDDPVIGVFSRLAPWKGQHVLLKALPHLPPSTQVIFVGDALFDGDEEYAETLRRQAAEQGVDDRVQFLGFRDDVPALMSLCDAVVHTSVAPEPFGRVIVEGMLANRPVVATRTGGALEIVNDGRTGTLVSPGNPHELATVLSRLLNNPQRAREIAQAGRTHARQEFSLPSMIQGVRRVLDRVVEG